MPIGKDKTRIILTIDKELLAWVDAQARTENRDRNNWIMNLIKCKHSNLKEASPMKNNTSVYLVFQTGLDVLAFGETKKEAKEVMEALKLQYPDTPLNVEEWDREEAEEVYPELFK